MKFRRFILILLALLVVLTVGSASTGLAKAPGGTEPVLKIDAEAAVLIEPNSGEVLYQKNQDNQLPPASVTKLMVMLLTLEALERGDLKLTDKITASPEACRMGGSQIWLEPGETMPVTDLFKAVCIVSANDASFALSEHLAGSEENFVSLMNKRAKELGLKNTYFYNTTGLEPDSGGKGNYTCAADMGRLAREVIKYPLVFKYSGTWIDSIRGGKSYLRNTNNLVRFFRGCDGLKTGFTAAAGFCLVATAKRDGVRLIAVAMKSPTLKTRSKDVSTLFNYGFSKFKAYSVYRGGEQVGQVRVFRGNTAYIKAMVPRELTAVLKRDQSGAIGKKIVLESLVKAPVGKGQKVGEVLLEHNGKNCGRIELVADRAVKRATLFKLWSQIFYGFTKTALS